MNTVDPKATRIEVYAAIDSERDYQNAKWNETTSSSGGKHSLEEFIVYMDDYLLEAKHILARNGDADSQLKALNTMRKVTTLGVACMEQLGAPHR